MILKHASHLRKPVRCSDTLDITGTPSALAVARLFMSRTLKYWRAPHVVDDMLSVGTELVTNAIQQCEKQPVIEWNYRPRPVSKLVRIRLLGFEASVAIEVWDRCPGEPQLLPVDFERESGRGLMMVDALSMNLGFYPVTPWGKVVWSELAVTHRAVSA